MRSATSAGLTFAFISNHILCVSNRFFFGGGFEFNGCFAVYVCKSNIGTYQSANYLTPDTRKLIVETHVFPLIQNRSE